MAARSRSASLELQAAMALLIQNQAAFQAQHIELVKLWKEHEETVREFREEFAAIKAILTRHEMILKNLPDALRQKIGFKGEPSDT